MKVSPDPAPAPTSTRAAEPQQKQPESKPFSETLSDTAARTLKGERKGAPKQAGVRIFGNVQEQVLTVPPLVPFESMQPVMQQTAPVAQANDTKDVDIIQSIVREIVVVTESGGPTAVDVQFNSKTLDGLRVQISGTKEEVHIRFFAASEPVMQLLQRHVGDLSDALQAKGLHITPVQVELRPPAIASTESRSPSHGSGGNSRDPHQEKRQR